uniref:Uncharacterized protein n=1 Tax=Arundo donax TaxID=35708 RepID=A0A0A9F1Y6_ARUDO
MKVTACAVCSQCMIEVPYALQGALSQAVCIMSTYPCLPALDQQLFCPVWLVNTLNRNSLL